VQIFHAGTVRQGAATITNGGRVLGVSAAGNSIERAVATVYEAAAKIHFEGAHYRKDIAATGRVHAAGD
jgi:phosphoribosylamine---glycine ligase